MNEEERNVYISSQLYPKSIKEMDKIRSSIVELQGLEKLASSALLEP